MEAAQTSWRSLGDLFVERGLISQADLERALAEEAVTKERLADILVAGGLVTGHDITSALMQQLTYFQPDGASAPADDFPSSDPAERDELDSTSFDLTIPAAEAEVVHLPLPEPANDPQEAERDEPEPYEPEPAAVAERAHEPEREDAPEPVVAIFEPRPLPTESLPELAIKPQTLINEADARRRTAESELAALGNVSTGLDQIWADLAKHELSTDSLTQELGAAQDRLRTRKNELAGEIALWQETREEIERRSQELDRIRAELADRAHELSETRATAASWNARVADLEAEVEALTEQADAAAGILDTLAATRVATPALDAAADIHETFAAPAASAEPEHDPAEEAHPDASTIGYLYFVPQEEGYELVEHDGIAPGADEVVEVNGQTWIVTKVGSSPLPHDRRSCVFLAAL